MAASETGDADVLRQLERIESKLGQAEAAASSAKSTGRLLTVVLVILVIGLMYRLLDPMIQIYKDPKPVQQALLKRLDTRIKPKAIEEANLFVKEDLPKLRGTVEAVANKRGPELATLLEKEALTLAGQLDGQLRAEMSAFSLKVAEDQYSRMIKEFPEIERLDEETDPKKPGVTKANLIIGALDPVSKRLVDEFLSTHFEALARLETEFHSFEVPADVKAMGDGELQDYASRLAGEYFAKRLDMALDSGLATRPEPTSTPAAQ